MRFVLNVIWLVLCGFWMAIGYVVAGVICCILIITIPFGIASFRIANYALWPFGRTAIRKPTAGAGSAIGNVIWVLVAMRPVRTRPGGGAQATDSAEGSVAHAPWRGSSAAGRVEDLVARDDLATQR